MKRFLPVLVAAAMMPGGLRAAGLSTHEGVREIAEPSVLTNSGAYVVTRDLYLLGGSAISVAADDVTIDLNGHRVNSVGLFSPYEAAIYQQAGFHQLTVVNGTVVGGSGAGILATGRMSCVKGVNVRDSARGGILLGDQAVVENCIVYSNTLGASYTDLVRVGQGSRVEAVLVSRNGGSGLVGIRGAKGCRVTDCVIRGNEAGGFFNGIVLEAGGVTESVVVRGNSGVSQFVGIGAGRDGVVQHGVVSGNRQTSGSGSGSGINAGENATLHRCLSRETTAGEYAYGFHHFGQGRISQCVAASNAASTQGFGFYVRTNVNVTASAASLNSAVGFITDDGCVIRQCVAKNNGATGISLGQWSSAERCLVDNTGANTNWFENGINTLGQNNRIENSHVSDSSKGIVLFASDNFLAGNSAINGITNYTGLSGSSYGAITNKPGANFVSTNPWQNFGL